MNRTLLSVAAALALSALQASAQQLGRRPQSTAALLQATAKLALEAPAVRPAVALAPVETPPAYNGESSKIFATKIHAILMNACASCHARSDFTGNYKLKRVDEGYANAVGIERNLLATVKQLDRADPGASPFLVKAIAAHGKSKDAPLHSANHPAYKYLELWAHWAARPEGSPMPTSIPVASVKRAELAAPIRPLADATRPDEAAKAPAPKTFAVEAKPAEAGRGNPDDPFDPSAFNRAAHPLRK